jgi:trehalose 6-phosphate synthase/phosphatase
MRLLVVSNRLPITAIENNGTLQFKESMGGLVSGISAYLDSLKGSSFTKSKYIWIGWPGISVAKAQQTSLKKSLLKRFQAYPTFLETEAMEDFYHGFCNKTIWPLFHYFPSYVVYKEDYWNQYQTVNLAFTESILEILKPGDTVWVHDYHLMLVPKMLRERAPQVSIGFFLHIPFPPYELFRLLPKEWRETILQGLLGADIIGFHTQEYTQYYLRCVLRLLGIEHNMGRITINDRIIKADTFPMGIDFAKFQQAASGPEVEEDYKNLKSSFQDYRVILSIDRLDYSKGILNRLRGYEAFLEKYHEWKEKVVLLLVVVPSRVGVDQYQKMKSQIDELVGEINGRFGNISWTPILYQYKYFSFTQLVSLYKASDLALITPLRDGMNLIAKEYIATRTDQTGVLILSEMAGAAKELGEAVIINPNHIEDIVAALVEALSMPLKEQIRRNRLLQQRLRRYDVVRWAEDFMNELATVKKDQGDYTARSYKFCKKGLIDCFNQAKSRILFLDYDGTLMPFVKQPEMASPPMELIGLLETLAKKDNTKIILISGRDRSTLEKWFGKLNVGLVAEHGAWIKEHGDNWEMLKPLDNSWKKQVLLILEVYADRLPGAFVEEKESSVIWHFSAADPELGSIRARELMDILINLTSNIDIQVFPGDKTVEIRSSGVNKGNAALLFLTKNYYAFILAIGDDWTDEDLFKVLPERALTLKVGLAHSCAKYYLSDYQQVKELLKSFLEPIEDHS